LCIGAKTFLRVTQDAPGSPSNDDFGLLGPRNLEKASLSVLKHRRKHQIRWAVAST
jgi:hypothetical protein